MAALISNCPMQTVILAYRIALSSMRPCKVQPASLKVFQDSRAIDRRARDPWLVAFRLQHKLQLLDLTGTWPTRAGASMAINTGSRFRAQRWSRVIYEAYPYLHGLYYSSSMHANQPAIALYERAKDTGALSAQPLFHRSLSDPSLLTTLRNAATDLGA